ncbi:MAG: serine/threonine protein kinase [Solirubrobacteraceae bacterium]|nr:serine/threonine protein kinase [Solirubrobacteraceae bacterium]
MHQARSAPAEELLLGRYRLLKRLGEGAMGVVWLAEDTRLHRRVAIKRVAGGAEVGGAKRAGREAVAAARLSHPAIVGLYEAGKDDEGDWLLVCELVRGPTLQALLRDGLLSDRDVAEIGIALCDALEHAHGRGVVHRDIKPANVICPDDVDEAGAVAKLTDFGVAHLAGDDSLTMTGDVLGTLTYMAPEQARGRAAGPPADVYALGIVLYEAFTGVNPRRGANAAETARLVDADITELERVRRDLPEALGFAIDAAVSPDVRSRPKPASLRAALRKALPELDDEPGLIEGGALETVTNVLQAGGRFARDVTQVAAGRWHAEPPLPVAGVVRPGDRDAARRATLLPARVGAALLGGGLALGALLWAAPAGIPAPALLALAVGAAVLLLPRLGWLAAAALLIGAVATRDPGVAVLVAAVVVPVPLLLPRAGTAWSVPALAPVLGIVGLAGAFPALAGQARRATVRAGLGALGAWWTLVAAGPLGHRVYLGEGTPAWTGSAQDAIADILAPLLSSGAIALVAVWAIAAAVLPILVRGWNAAADIAAATGWAAGTAAATDGIATAMDLPRPNGLVLGAIVAGVAAVVARAVVEPDRPE